MYKQREVLFINFPISDTVMEPHPCIVISNQLIYDMEEKYYAVMISSKQSFSPTELELKNSDLNFSLDKRSFAKSNLIAEIFDLDVIRRLGTIKIDGFDKIIKHINSTTFSRKEIW